MPATLSVHPPRAFFAPLAALLALCLALSACLPEQPRCGKPVTPAQDETPASSDTGAPIDRPFSAAGTPQIGLVAPNIVALPIVDGRVIHGGQEAYVPEFLDYVSSGDGQAAPWLIRKGQKVGILVGQERSTLVRFDRVEDRLPDTSWLDKTSSYQLLSPGDTAYTQPQHPVRVERKSRPIDLAETGPDVFAPPPRLHTLYLHFSSPLREGQEYRVRITGGKRPDQTFRFKSEQTRSEALHVNTLGFHPADGRKIGFLSLWAGSGGGLSYPADLPFKVIADGSGETVFSGRIGLPLAGIRGEDHQYRNFSGTDVHLLDFSPLERPGRYRLVVPGIGCSYPFVISPDVWARAFVVNTRGLYHQRSGMAFDGSFSPYLKPRDLHPDDGVKVYQSTCTLLESANGLNTNGFEKDNFFCLRRGKTNTLVPAAWGGYHDAGDWDRRIQHLDATRNLIELYELFPQVMRTQILDLPESDNALPDVLDEVLWGMDFFRRLQMPDGGIRGGIESSGHPLSGESSWLESHTLMAYAPDLWSSYLYAADAARLTLLLRPFNAPLAADYQASATKAMHYAEKNFAQNSRTLPHQVVDARNLAAVAFYKLTGEDAWHRIYRETNRIDATDPRLQKAPQGKNGGGWNQQDAAFLYLTLTDRAQDPELKANLLKAYATEADAAIKRINRTGFRWLKESDDAWIGWGTLGASGARLLLRAHWLTGEQRHLDAALDASQFALGANPLNMSFTSGLGHHTVRRLWVIDARVSRQEVPAGITAYGPIDPVHLKDNQHFNAHFAPWIYPQASGWPANENYFDAYAIYPMNEFTISETIAPNLYVWGYLSAVYPPSAPSSATGAASGVQSKRTE